MASSPTKLRVAQEVSDDLDGDKYRLECGTGEWGILLAYLVCPFLPHPYLADEKWTGCDSAIGIE
jgi:hypothetical protein